MDDVAGIRVGSLEHYKDQAWELNAGGGGRGEMPADAEGTQKFAALKGTGDSCDVDQEDQEEEGEDQDQHGEGEMATTQAGGGGNRSPERCASPNSDAPKTRDRLSAFSGSGVGLGGGGSGGTGGEDHEKGPLLSSGSPASSPPPRRASCGPTDPAKGRSASALSLNAGVDEPLPSPSAGRAENDSPGSFSWDGSLGKPSRQGRWRCACSSVDSPSSPPQTQQQDKEELPVGGFEDGALAVVAAAAAAAAAAVAAGEESGGYDGEGGTAFGRRASSVSSDCGNGDGSKFWSGAVTNLPGAAAGDGVDVDVGVVGPGDGRCGSGSSVDGDGDGGGAGDGAGECQDADPRLGPALMPPPFPRRLLRANELVLEAGRQLRQRGAAGEEEKAAAAMMPCRSAALGSEDCGVEGEVEGPRDAIGIVLASEATAPG